MRKTLLVLTVAMSALLWMSRSEPAYAKTLACQGLQSGASEEVTGSESGAGESMLASFTSLSAADDASLSFVSVSTLGNAAVWSVTITNSNFTGGNLTATVGPLPISTLVSTCFYTLDSTSSFTSNNGAVQQTLIWDPVSSNSGNCSDRFTDHVYLVSNGAGAVMVDDDLAGKEVPGSGTCIWL